MFGTKANLSSGTHSRFLLHMGGDADVLVEVKRIHHALRNMLSRTSLHDVRARLGSDTAVNSLPADTAGYAGAGFHRTNINTESVSSLVALPIDRAIVPSDAGQACTAVAGDAPGQRLPQSTQNTR